MPAISDPIANTSTSCSTSLIEQKNIKNTNTVSTNKTDTDSYTSSTTKQLTDIDPEHDGKCSFKQACKKFFVDGILNNITQIIKHPAQTLLIAGGTTLLAGFIPLLIPMMIYGGIALGACELIFGIAQAMKAYKNHDYDSIENSFKNIGSGIFNLATIGSGKNILSRGFTLFGKSAKLALKETALWYKNCYFPQLRQLDKAAIGFGIFSLADGAHLGHSILTLNAPMILLDMLIFITAKYLYIGYHYREPISQATRLLKKEEELRKLALSLSKQFSSRASSELLSQLKSYLIRGDRSVLLGIFSECDKPHPGILTTLIQLTQLKVGSQQLTTAQRDRAIKLINLLLDWSKTNNPRKIKRIEALLTPYAERAMQTVPEISNKIRLDTLQKYLPAEFFSGISQDSPVRTIVILPLACIQ